MQCTRSFSPENMNKCKTHFRGIERIKTHMHTLTTLTLKFQFNIFLTNYTLHYVRLSLSPHALMEMHCWGFVLMKLRKSEATFPKNKPSEVELKCFYFLVTMNKILLQTFKTNEKKSSKKKDKSQSAEQERKKQMKSKRQHVLCC